MCYNKYLPGCYTGARFLVPIVSAQPANPGSDHLMNQLYTTSRAARWRAMTNSMR